MKKIQTDLLPAEIELIATNPIDAVVAQIAVSAALALVFSLPIITYHVFSFLFPALKPKERRLALWAIIPGVVMFVLGCFLCYFYFLPLTLKILSSYVSVLDIKPYFEIGQFIVFVVLLTLISGLIFLLPLVMIVSTSLGLVKSEFWRINWRMAFISFLIFAVIVTPDNSGITAIVITLILVFLYTLGYYGSRLRR